MPRILTLAYEYPPPMMGGLGRFNSELYKEISKLGYDVEIFRTSSAMDGQEKHAAQGNEISGLHRSYPIYSLRDVSIYDVQCVLQSARNPGDLIHAHDWMNVPPAVLLKLRKIPLVLNFHQSTRGERRTKSEGNLGPKSRILAKYRIALEALGGVLAERVVTVSIRMKNELVSNYGISPEKITVVYNGVDLERFNGNTDRNRLAGMPQKQRSMLLFVGRIVPSKGIIQLIRSLKIVKKNHSNVFLIVVGTGPYLRSAQEFAVSLGLEEHVRFVGKVSDSQLPFYYAACDVFVCPSYYEPFGMTCLEAMASSKPIIVTRNCGASEIIKTGVHGLIVPSHNSLAMAESIEYLLSDNEKAIRMGTECRKLAERFSWGEIAKQYDVIYKDILRH